MKIQPFLLLMLLPLLLFGCIGKSNATNIKVGLLLEDTIDDEGWNSKGYEGLLNIHANMNIDVTFKERVNTEKKIQAAIDEFVSEDVTLIFGHGHIFAHAFTTYGKAYPHIHFVSFNGEVEGDNITSLHFSAYAMGYFAGMLASHMSKTDQLGVIAAFSWQPEVVGFKEGAQMNNERTVIHTKYVKNWTDEKEALRYFHLLQEEGVDVFYPAGDGYHVSILEEAKKEGLFVIGYIADQSDLGKTTVLTSTVQHVEQLYELVVEQYRNKQLESGNVHYDFEDGVITLGSFSPEVPDHIVTQLEEAVNTYIQTGELPKKPLY